MRKVVRFFVLILVLVSFSLSIAVAQLPPTPNTCVGCPIVSPVPYVLANCTPTPSVTPTATPTNTATPYVCVDSPYDTAIGSCNYHCNRRYCNGVVVSNSCGPAFYCQCPDSHFAYPNRCRSDCWYSGYWNGSSCAVSGGYSCTRDACHCFHPDTNILMADGSLKLARDVKSEEYLWNPVLRKPVMVKGIWVGPETPQMYKFTAGEQKLVVTDKHPMVILKKEPPSSLDIVRSDSAALTGISLESSAPQSALKIDNYVIRQARHLKVGDQMYTTNGHIVAISSIELVHLPADEKVYHFDLEGDPKDPRQHMIVGDGLVTGDGIMEDKGYEVVGEPQ